MSYEGGWGQPVQWEVEALDPTELQCLVRAAVTPYIDQAVLGDRIAEEERHRKQLRAFAYGWPSSHPRAEHAQHLLMPDASAGGHRPAAPVPMVAMRPHAGASGHVHGRGARLTP
ncbi:hypothetical protein [Streptomyces sp. NBC_00316]|uniref:hypothetical protein n=1 Tax=Streptomyces sp. NBC_00316 TaxID=2975710 RepID=UPI002E2E37F4|nr:hypothetical protein [Streptomyces sp. NBC_00316]